MYQTEDYHAFHDIVASAHVLTAVEPQINVIIAFVTSWCCKLTSPAATPTCWHSREQKLFCISLAFLAQLLHHAVRHRDGVLFVALVRVADLAKRPSLHITADSRLRVEVALDFGVHPEMHG